MRRLLAAMALGALMCSAASAQAPVPPVKIGVLNDQSGPYADLGGAGSVIAAQMAIEDFGGSVLGKPIELVSADHQNKPDVGSAIAKRWLELENVDAIVDVPHSATAFAVLAVTQANQKMLLLSGPAHSDFTGRKCAPTTIHWTYDSYAMANGTARAMVKAGGDTWFFLTGDNAGTISLQDDAARFVQQAGGKVIGSVRHPLNNADFSSHLLQAQSSKAKVVGLANAGADTVNSVKQAAEFGIVDAGQKLAGLLVFISDIHGIGLKNAQGLVTTEAFYWDLDDATRAWSKRFMARNNGRAPTSVQAGVYGAITHYLKAVKAANSKDSLTASKKMKEMPVNDFFSKDVLIREDGRVVRDMYLLEVKTPSASKYPWDYYTVLARIPGAEAFRPMAEGGCPLVQTR